MSRSQPFQRPVLAVASYASPPAFSASRRGHFFVPFPPDGASPAEIQQRLENNSHAGIPTTAVHEAYPGHHWHLVTMKAHPSPIRLTFRTPYFSEGWALYAEHMMREQGFFTDPRHELYQVEAMLFRAARIVVDTSLHAGDMTLERGAALHGGAGEPHRADGAGRGRALRRLAHPGVGLPGGLPRDPRDPRAPTGASGPGWRRRPSATSTTVSQAAAGSRPRWRSARSRTSAERAAPLGGARSGACQGLGGRERADQAEGQEEVGPVAVDPPADEQKPGGGETDENETRPEVRVPPAASGERAGLPPETA